MTEVQSPLCGAATELADAEILEIVRKCSRDGSDLGGQPFWALRLESVCDLRADHDPVPHASLQIPTSKGLRVPWLRWDDRHMRVITWLLACPHGGGGSEEDECLLYEGHPDDHYLWDGRTACGAPSYIAAFLPANYGKERGRSR